MVDIRIRDLTPDASPVAGDIVAIDGATTRGATLQNISIAGRPTATMSDAVTGTDAFKAMTAVATKQSIASEVGVSIASKAQGDLASSALQPASPTATGILTVGTSPYPDPKNSITTTANTTSGSPNITVADGSQVSNGDRVVASAFAPANAYVLSGGGTNNIVMSRNATATLTGTTVRFGYDRYDLTSTARANTGAFKSVLVGGATKGRSTWLGDVNGDGLDYEQICALTSLNDTGAAVAGVFGSRMSDGQGNLSSIQTLINIAYVDLNPNGYNSWAQYEQGNLSAASAPFAKWHANEESSIESFWTTVDITPYSINAVGSTRVKRLDAGIGTYNSGTGPRAYLGPPTNISAFMDFPNNDAQARSGLVFGSTSLDTSSGRTPPVLAMAPNHALTWFNNATNEAWKIFSSATTGSGYLWLQSGKATFGSVNLSISQANGISKGVNFETANTVMWNVGATATSNSGSNAGSDFAISRFSDAGAFIAISFQIRRSTGRIALPELAASTSYANDAAAAAGGVGVNELYRNGSQLMIRIV